MSEYDAQRVQQIVYEVEALLEALIDDDRHLSARVRQMLHARLED